ncbi:hypothetical protein NLA06_09295 [Desulfomicrobium sp. ZS1]|jgi:hypothetical protein|uniref:hypothetical protein n=1 Tax=Desulfomicrobium sp. ZS1 TaxID=2952228 RepID=UPI0020B1DA49|nr:hypothetical protein [Desulfomicrobium sp. ZS1]UTF48782.1 hypothetical protein NLA06_09295 [Desulfomicrobium sp. ZS1]
MARFIVIVRPSCQDVIPAQAGSHAFAMAEDGSPFSRGRHHVTPNYFVIPAQAGIHVFILKKDGFPFSRE